ncbi:unnamed protein product, partial [Didymodactylos carnosus]
RRDGDMLAAVLHAFDRGSKISQVDTSLDPLYPPVTKTFPDDNKVALCPRRGDDMLAVAFH